MDSKCIAFKFQMLTWHVYLDLTISNLIGLKCTCDLCLQTYFIHSLPLLHNGKTLNTPNKATIFITHNLHTDFSKLLLPLFYEYIQNLALGILYFLYLRDSQFVTGAIFTFKTLCGGFPGDAVVESLPANAGDTGSSPGLGRSHMPRSNWAREPQLLSLRVWSLCSATWEARAPRWRVAPTCHN